MGKIYTLIGTLNGGRRGGFVQTMANSYAVNGGRVGGDGTYSFGTNALFDADVLNTLRSKSISSISLELTINGTLYAKRNDDPYYDTYLIAYKLNGTGSTESSGDAWTTSDADSTAAAVSRIAQINSGTDSTITGTNTVTFDLTGSSVPKYGYVFRPVAMLTSTITVTAAVLTIITDEPDSSTISADDGTMGSPLTISISREDASFVDTITYAFGEQTGTIVERTSAASVTWTPPASLALEIPDRRSDVCTLTVATYDGDTLLGASSINIVLTTNAKVTIDAVTLTETVSGIASKIGAFVQSKSKVQISVSTDATAAYGASVTAYRIVINGQTLAGNNAITDAITAFGTLPFSVQITDSRGYTDTYQGTYNVLQYNAPTVTATAERDESAPEDVDVDYTIQISDLGNANDKQIEFYHKEIGAQSFVNDGAVTPAQYVGSGTYTINDTDMAVANIIELRVSDYFETVIFDIQVAAFGARALQFSATDGTMAVGGFNTSDGDHHFKGHDLRIDTGVLKLGEGTAEWTETDAAEYAVTRARSSSSATSFAQAVSRIQSDIGDSALSYGATVADRIRTNISSYPSGIYDVSSGGPRFCALVGKYTDSFWTAHLWSYQYQWRMFIRYLNGACAVELTDYPYTRQ